MERLSLKTSGNLEVAALVEADPSLRFCLKNLPLKTFLQAKSCEGQLILHPTLR